MSVKKEMDVIRKALKEDEGYWIAWQANIAMAFLDRLHNSGYKFPDDHMIANDAAIDFLKNLTRDIEENKKEKTYE